MAVTRKLNLTLNQGAEFQTSFSMTDSSGNPMDLSSYSGRSQMRKHYTSSNAAATFTVSVNASGNVSISLPSAQTTAISPGRYLYDVEIVSASNSVTRIVEGIITVSPNITR